MRKGWIDTTIGELAQINPESLGVRTPSDYEFGYIDLSMVNEGQITYPSEKIRYNEASPRARRKLMKGDILLSTVRPNLKGFGHIEQNAEDLICSTGFAVLRCQEKETTEYLYQYIFSDFIYRQIDALVVGSNYPAINNDDVQNLEITIPTSLDERSKIAAILSTWDDAIEKISSLISKQKQEKHVFQTKIFSGMLIPKSHKKKNTSLYDLADWHNGLAFKNIDFSETGRPVLKIAELKAGVTSTTAFTNGKYAENVLVKSGDLLFSWSGNPDTSIDAFIWDGPEGWLNQHIFRVVPKPDVQKEYLYQFLRHIKNRLAYIATGKQSTGLGHVTKADMKRTYLVLPDMDDQIKISGLLNNFDILISGLERQKKIFQSQKRGLMQKLLTGEWRVNVSGDAEAA